MREATEAGAACARGAIGGGEAAALQGLARKANPQKRIRLAR